MFGHCISAYIDRSSFNFVASGYHSYSTIIVLATPAKIHITESVDSFVVFIAKCCHATEYVLVRYSKIEKKRRLGEMLLEDL